MHLIPWGMVGMSRRRSRRWCVWGLLAGGAGSVELMTHRGCRRCPSVGCSGVLSHHAAPAGTAESNGRASPKASHLTYASVIVTANIASMVIMGEDESAAQPARNGILVTHYNTVDLMMSVRRSRKRTSLHKTIARQHNSGIARWAQPNTNSDHTKTIVRQQN